ncbi:MAG TPA: 4-(cytidine 5'-diphospho)-2-C-methyl-D-erythritol kinase [Frankiaceae bacterium]|jgi:4-diphosphocytidyl-2-C-methyl-D-erythritol kinase|nr:4-(cytidine 5'-diphospho)-2-C-methyl-D-erythritol kinase [Frankiaceae bacterium]
MVTVRVPGKVNLHLAVGARRGDGYHDVTTVFQAVGLYDDVVASASDDDEITCTISGEGATTLPRDSRNLAVAAALRLAAVAGVTSGVRLHLVKGIPVAGGMAGGSADAAGALVACDALWGTGLPREEIEALAASLGSDVPFALHGGSALGVGRGEQVSPVLARGQFHWVFALAEAGLATSSVYEEHDRGDPMPVREPDGVLAALRASDVVALGRALHNDLQVAALRLRPALRRTLDAGMERGALGAVVSGSGPTCAFLCATRSDAVALAAGLAGAGVCRSVRTAHGPVAGARVVEP